MARPFACGFFVVNCATFAPAISRWIRGIRDIGRKSVIHDETLSLHCPQYIPSLSPIHGDQYPVDPESLRNRCATTRFQLRNILAILFTIVDSIVHDLLGSDARVSLRRRRPGRRNLPGAHALRGMMRSCAVGLIAGA